MALIAEYKGKIQNTLQKFEQFARQIDYELGALTELTSNLFKDYLELAADQDNPNFKDTLLSIKLFKEWLIKNSKNFKSHIGAINEGLAILFWQSSQSPTKYIKNVIQAVREHAKGVVAERKKHDLHKNWIHNWLYILQEFNKLVEELLTNNAHETVSEEVVLESGANGQWLIENHVDKKLIVNNTQIDDGILIHNCHQCLILVKTDINTITVASCSDVHIAFADVHSKFEMSASSNILVQASKSLPQVFLSDVHQVKFYLTTDSLSTKVHSTNVVDTYLMMPKSNGSFEEARIPETFTTTIENFKLITKPNLK